MTTGTRVSRTLPADLRKPAGKPLQLRRGGLPVVQKEDIAGARRKDGIVWQGLSMPGALEYEDITGLFCSALYK